MKILTNKNVILKIVIALVIVILFNFSAPTISNAGIGKVIGGSLLAPIVDLLISIGDAGMNIIQKIIFNADGTLIKVSTKTTDWLPKLVGGLLGGLVIGASIILTGGASIPALIGAGAAAYAGHKVTESALPKKFYLPVYVVSPEEMFKNKISLLDVNFFTPNPYDDIVAESGEVIQQPASTASQLRGVISNWYRALRNFAIIVLLSVLLYIGIRIIISSTAQDKAKYKEKLSSWLVAMCLLFFMHYLMSFATMTVEAISEGINEVNKPILLDLPLTKSHYIETKGKNDDGEVETQEVNAIEFFEENDLTTKDADGNTVYMWPSNLMGIVRLEMQLEPEELDDDNLLLRKLGYTILFLLLVFYTIAFLVVYIKRVIMIAFLTTIAPLVAMTYPLDKINDGNAQAFNLWMKEYIFNLLIQPLHLILYTMLIGSAIEFAQSNIIYAIVVMGFLFQAEKLMRKFFGFSKAETISGGSAIGGALAMAGINQLKRLTKGAGKAAKGAANKVTDANGKINFNRKADSGKDINSRIDETYNNGTNNEKDDNKGTQNDEYPSQDKYREQLKESGYTDDEINEMTKPPKGYEGTQTKDTNIEPTIDPEDDNRGVLEAIGDSYQGSRVQGAVNRVTAGPRRLGRTIGNGIDQARDAGSKVARKPLINTLKGGAATLAAGARYVAPKAAGLYAKGIMAGTAGIIGAVGGLASDDDRNIWKYGAAGLGTGWLAGAGAVNLGERALEATKNAASTAASTYTINAKGLQAEKERQQAIIDKKLMKDKNRRQMYASKLGVSKKEDIDKIMDAAQAYRESGVTDDEIIVKAMKAKGFGDELASNEKIILAGLASRTGDDVKKINDIENRLKKRGLSETDVTKYVDGIREITGSI